LHEPNSSSLLVITSSRGQWNAISPLVSRVEWNAALVSSKNVGVEKIW